MRARGFGLSDLARLMAQKPAELAQLGGRKGVIAAGYDADLTIFDPDAWIEVTPDMLHTRHRVSPYIGEKLRGKVIATYLRGNSVFANHSFAVTPFGMEV
jgi:allantoinase